MKAALIRILDIIHLLLWLCVAIPLFGWIFIRHGDRGLEAIAQSFDETFSS